MPFANGIFTRLRNWVADAAAGLNMQPDLMDQDANDIALGLSNCILRDGTGKPTNDVSWNGHKITSLKAPTNAGDAMSLGTTPATEITSALGFKPVSGGAVNQVAITFDGTGLTAAVDGSTYFGRVWTANTLTFAALNGIAGQTLYGTANLTASQIGGILGYTPGHVTTPFSASSSGAGDLSSGTPSVVAAVRFVATGGSVMLVGNAKAYNNTSGSGAIEVAIYAQIYDVTIGGVLSNGISESAHVTYGFGNVILSCQLVTGGLVIGRTYEARLYMFKGSTAGVTPFQAVVLGGFNA